MVCCFSLFISAFISPPPLSPLSTGTTDLQSSLSSATSPSTLLLHLHRHPSKLFQCDFDITASSTSSLTPTSPTPLLSPSPSSSPSAPHLHQNSDWIPQSQAKFIISLDTSKIYLLIVEEGDVSSLIR